MRTVIQRVSEARVRVDGSVVGEIGIGLLLLIGVARGDKIADVEKVVEKVSGLRIFPDDESKMNKSITDVGGSILIVSQFTLLGSVRRGRRPAFTDAALPEDALPLIDALISRFAELGIRVEEGVFGARMQVELLNDGPVTIIVDVIDGQVI